MRVLDLSHGDIHDISYEELQNQFEKDIYRIRVLEKALDKAIDELCSKECPININDRMCQNRENHDCKKCWRDYLMKGEEE